MAEVFFAVPGYLDALAEGVEKFHPFLDRGFAAVELAVEGIELLQDFAQEFIPGDVAGGYLIQADGGVSQFVDFSRVEGNIDADADDGVADGVAGDGAFDEDAGYFFAVEEDVVGPFDAGFEAADVGDGADDGDTAKAVEVGQGFEGGIEDEGEVEVAGAGYPGAAVAAAAGGLGFGDNDGAFVGAALGAADGFVHGGGDFLKVEETLADQAGEQATAQGFRDQICGHSLILFTVSVRAGWVSR